MRLNVRCVMRFVMLFADISVCLWFAFGFDICSSIFKSSNWNVVWVFSSYKRRVLLWNMHGIVRLLLWIGVTALKLQLCIFFNCCSRFRSFAVFSDFILIFCVNCGDSLNSIFLLRTCSRLLIWFIGSLSECSLKNHVDYWKGVSFSDFLRL